MSVKPQTAPAPDSASSPSRILCVDLDGTLVHSDLLWESLLSALKGQPWIVLLLPFWLLSGKATFKRRVAAYGPVNAARLPYNGEVVEFVEAARRSGTRTVLATATEISLARGVFDHVACFDELVATEGTNLSGRTKRDRLVERFGEKGFDYAGNGTADFAVWPAAKRAVIVNDSKRFVERVASTTAVERVFPARRISVRAVFRSLRLHQWVKNLLVFAPLILSHHVRSWPAIQSELWAFLAFGLAASAAYVLNDLLDLDADRAHESKRSRPFASGELPIALGVAMVPALMLAAFAAAAFRLPTTAAALVAFYFVITCSYSLWLKRLALLDVLVLASLYTLRIFVGAVVIDVVVSTWLLAFSCFFFLSLAMAKRFAELFRPDRQGNETIAGRGYRRDDREVMNSFGTSAGYVSILVMALYINSADVKPLYPHAQVLWLVCPILMYWISRIWLLAHRGELRDDPIVVALRDPLSLLLGVLTAVVIAAATL